MTDEPLYERAEAEAWSRARGREAVLRPLTAQPLSKAIVQEAIQRIGGSRTHFYRLLAAYRRRPQTSTLLPRRDGRAPGTQQLPVETESLVHNCIEEYYMSRVRPSFAALVRAVSQECRRSALRVPNYRTIRRRLAAYDPKELMISRLGAKAASEVFRPVQANHPPALPFQLLQIDQTLVDLIVVDERDRLPIGRPWITLAIDVATRVVAGFYLSLNTPSVISVALVLTQCVLPKDAWLADRRLNTLEWPVAGIPDSSPSAAFSRNTDPCRI